MHFYAWKKGLKTGMYYLRTQAATQAVQFTVQKQGSEEFVPMIPAPGATTKDDLEGIDYVYRSFYWYGPSINYNSSNNSGFGRMSMTTYAQLMVATDPGGKPWSYLATEAAFRVMKDLETRNMLVPVVGNFGGPRALKAVGRYVRDHDATVGAFYLSNVEQYLFGDGKERAFYANVSTLPIDSTSVFIRPYSMRRGGGGGVQSLCRIAPFLAAANAGRVYGNESALACVR